MFRNVTLITLVVALITVVAVPATFAAQSASSDSATLEAPAQVTTSTVSAQGASLVDRLVGFFLGIAGSAWDGDSNNADAGGRDGDIGANFDPNSRT